MPLGPDPSRAGAVLARLDGLRADVTAAEDDVLACLVVTGEPRPQRVLDDWLDQVADTLRAVGEVAADLVPALDRYAGSTPTVAGAGRSVGEVAAAEEPPLERLGSNGASHPSRARPSIPGTHPGRNGHHDLGGPT